MANLDKRVYIDLVSEQHTTVGVPHGTIEVSAYQLPNGSFFCSLRIKAEDGRLLHHDSIDIDIDRLLRDEEKRRK